jgi:hypothetical protein
MKFEQSRPDHEVHEIHHPMGHGLQDERTVKGNRSPYIGAIPQIDNGTVPGSTAGGPGADGGYSPANP